MPLIVDVDGTLIVGDLLADAFARMLFLCPGHIFSIVLWFIKGRAYLKRKLALNTTLAPETLIFHPCVLKEIASARKEGRDVYLASASDEIWLVPLAEKVGAKGFYGSNGHINLLGEKKADLLVNLFGEKGFDYIGNEWRDIEVWKKARHCLGVGLSKSLSQKVSAIDKDARFFPKRSGNWKDYLKGLRPHQWFKNVLVFVPLLTAHETRPNSYLMAMGLLVALSICASGSYLWNDLLDFAYDRQHPSKRHRPLASGKISYFSTFILGLTLIIAGVGGIISFAK